MAVRNVFCIVRISRHWFAVQIAFAFIAILIDKTPVLDHNIAVISYM